MSQAVVPNYPQHSAGAVLRAGARGPHVRARPTQAPKNQTPKSQAPENQTPPNQAPPSQASQPAAAPVEESEGAR